MSVESDLKYLLTLRSHPKIYHRKDNKCIWHLKGHSHQVEACKTTLLDFILKQYPFLIIQYDEDPQKYNLEGIWTKMNDRAWRVPAGAKAAQILEWLHLGGWQLYPAAQAVPDIPDLFRLQDEAIEQFLTTSHLSFIIDSFHDDDSWILGIHRCETRAT